MVKCSSIMPQMKPKLTRKNPSFWEDSFHRKGVAMTTRRGATVILMWSNQEARSIAMQSARTERTRAGGAGLVCLTGVTSFSGPFSRHHPITCHRGKGSDQIALPITSKAFKNFIVQSGYTGLKGLLCECIVMQLNITTASVPVVKPCYDSLYCLMNNWGFPDPILIQCNTSD